MSHTLHRALAACFAVAFLASVHGSAAAQTRGGASPQRGVPAVPAPDGRSSSTRRSSPASASSPS